MANLHRNRFSDEMSRPFSAVNSHCPAPADTQLHQQSFQNPLQHQSFLINPLRDESLESVFSRLNVDSMNKFSGFDYDFCDASVLYGESILHDLESTGFSSDNFLPDFYSTSLNQNGFLCDSRIGLESTDFSSDNFLPDFCSTSLNQIGFLCDSRIGELHHNPYSIITPSPNRNGFFNSVVSEKHNVTRSSLSRPQLLQGPLDGLYLRDLKGNFLSLAMDHRGSRFLQKIIKSTTPKEELDMIFLELIDYVYDLMVDPFGNYVLQKLVEVCSEDQRTQILLMLTKTNFQLVRICLDMHGTRAVQKLLEYLTTPQQISLVTAAISTGAVALTKDINGHHVIQHCLKYFSDDDNKYILNELANNCYGVATDKSGCCVLQQCVQYSRGEPRDRLVAEIIANALHLADDHYGNYVVQHLLDMKVPQITIDLLTQLEGHYVSLSCNKYGSNVVEKCLKVSGEQQSMRITVELLRSPNASMLLFDRYGNYVIQSALSVSKGFLFDALRNLVKINYNAMRNNIYGEKVISWFKKNKRYI